MTVQAVAVIEKLNDFPRNCQVNLSIKKQMPATFAAGIRLSQLRNR